MAGGKLMKALQYHGGGATLKHVEVPIPDPGKGEMLLKVEATSLNPSDPKTHNLKRLLHPFLSRNTLIPGTDVAGEVMEVGPNVKDFKAGDKVVAGLNFFSGGGLAEYCIAGETSTVHRPPELSPAEASGIPIAALTALLAVTDPKFAGLKLDGTGPRKNILITSASGGVGHYAVQLAKLGNAFVTATCGARNLELVKSLGADEVLDYKTSEGAALKSPSGKKYDVVIHCARVAFSWSVFKPNLSEDGKVIDLTAGLGTAWTIFVQRVTFSKKRMMSLLLTGSGKDLKSVVELLKQGKIRTVIDSVYPLSEGEVAWSKILDGHATGKVIVEP